MSGATAFSFVTLDCITIYTISPLPCTVSVFIHFLLYNKTCPLFLASCNCASLTHFSPSSHFPLIVQPVNDPATFTQPPVPLPPVLEINRVVVSVLAVPLLIWRVVGGVALPAAPDAPNLRRPHCSPLAPPDCSQLPLKGWDFIDAQSAFLHGQRAQNYTPLLQFQHIRILLSAPSFKHYS